MGRLFGTDGVRGIANRDLSIGLATEIGVSLAMVMRERSEEKPVVLVGKDTRASSDMIESALVAGLCSGGVDVQTMGVVPTPAVAYMVTKHKATAGVMISASHNPYEFNGIKIFGSEGFKLSEEEEEEIENIILDHTQAFIYAAPKELGRVTVLTTGKEEYIDHVAGTITGNLSGIKVLVDCSNGSASSTAKALFAKLGCQVDILHNHPDGYNINTDCGSTHVGLLSKQVVDGGYDMAVAFDGDADRCLAVDHLGHIVDGDQMIAIFAHDMKQENRLKNNTAVVTVMSNYGFFQFAKDNDIDTRATKVGDKYVLETMVKEGYVLGGEQSGHIIFSQYMTTGDGQLSAVQLIDTICRRGKSLHELSQIMKVMPQKLLNVTATRDMKAGLNESVELNHIIRAGEAQLEGRGRVLLRPSGTEPLIRVMAEGDNLAEIEEIVNQIAKGIEQYL